MQIAVKNIFDNNLRKDFQMNIPSELINQKINEHIAKIQPEFVAEGFTKGQVPSEKIKEQYGKTFMAEQTDLLISEVLSKIMSDNNYKIASYPKIDFKTFEENKDIDLVASFEIFPAIPEIDLTQIKLNKHTFEISEEEIELASLKTLRSKLNWVKQEIGYQANNGDILIINYDGKIDGASFEGSKGDGFSLELGTKTFIDNFEDQLIGKTINDKVEVVVSFPSDYFRPKLANKKAVFEVVITSILKAEEVEFNDDFIKNATGYDDLEDLQDAIFEQTSFNYENTCRAIFKKDFFDYLDANYKIELPNNLVEEQVKFLENALAQNPNTQQIDKNSPEVKEKNLKLSQRMVRCGLILANIADKNGIIISQEDIDDGIENLVQMYPTQKEQILETYKNNPQALQQLTGSILEEKTINLVVEKASLTEVSLTTKQLDKMWYDISNNN